MTDNNTKLVSSIDSWYRIASLNLYTRLQVVDAKSNILITINSIILSVILGTLYMRLDQDPHLVYGIVPMVIANLTSISFAIFATRPALGKGTASSEEINSSHANLMTFDDFYKMPFTQFDEALTGVLQHEESLQRSIRKDMHRLGQDLSRRYWNIRIAYNVFLVGLTVSIILFGVCHAFF